MRGASRNLKIMLSFFHIEMSCPTWFCGRLWILRLGYYKLTREKDKADDWVWIIDHTVQIGAEKCLVILGIRLCNLPAVGTCLSHEDVEPIALVPVKQSNGEIVYQQLEENVEKTGVPREIIADHGSDLRSGMEKFCRNHQQTSSVYDIKHKTASLLKDEFQEDEAWQEFTRLAAQTKRKVQQTSTASLAPPNQRTKSRYMNVDTLIQWGQKALSFYDASVLGFIDEQQKGKNKEFDQKQIEEKLGWIGKFREQIGEWGECMQIITTTESMVRREGLYQGLAQKLKEHLAPMVHTERSQRIQTKLLAFVAEQSLKAKPGERLVGSSEVIESVFGKLKRMEQDQSNSGFTGLLLSIGAMVSTTSKEVIQKALETVPTKKVLTWCEENLGQSIQAKRKKVFGACGKTEQKSDQIRQVA